MYCVLVVLVSSKTIEILYKYSQLCLINIKIMTMKSKMTKISEALLYSTYSIFECTFVSRFTQIFVPYYFFYVVENRVNGVCRCKKIKGKSVNVLKIFISYICIKTIIIKVNGGIPHKRKDY